ncbi:hypothetical protein K491DRAFT_719876 [Lophiostoma macrostomum CBS 122681]|uniref:Uncharacterized protein n=1 Tax=Lophiostoma macrostomum CBS 122681 TaxID=1314788 RepID=A0A6A6SY17_9PLEO|nr:hypothetical protein K491DRAFT_719876 [Lophiostoma macrostomum CBS 122681]
MPPTTRRMSRATIQSPTPSELPTIPTIDESIQSTGTVLTPNRPVGVDTPTVDSEQEYDDAIHEHIVEHVTRALHREDSGIWSGSDDEHDEEEEVESEGHEEEGEGGIKIDKADTVTIEMSGDNLYMRTSGPSISDEDDASDASSTRKDNRKNEHEDVAGDQSSVGTPAVFSSDEDSADEEDEEEGGISIPDASSTSRRSRETSDTGPSVMRPMRRTVATTMPNPPTRSLTATSPMLPMVLEPRQVEEIQISMPKSRYLGEQLDDWYMGREEEERKVAYICANLTDGMMGEHETEIKWGEPMRCKTCNCRVMYKKRTKRMVQFDTN